MQSPTEAQTPLEKLVDLASVLADRLANDEHAANALVLVDDEADVPSRPVAGSPMRAATLGAIAREVRGLIDHVVTPAMLRPTPKRAPSNLPDALDVLMDEWGWRPVYGSRSLWCRVDDTTATASIAQIVADHRAQLAEEAGRDA